ncbi:hypothetical protein H257_02601 [Aphanomyces astaci]|uniref:Uncharacterized protein n=1 Tax=Aphanomyces astaci TaxID=112090 RepID=W4H4T4_APHAT|nr:hypothetical protein H257_02601 [Aphanomyces astaci]ETV86143.1 hypothetical protein H257_02601 [Aphanomyces astaci]|eukprot:XP_009824615.1 hypothetical protein H257_02601 [Aphanomyces astaci]
MLGVDAIADSGLRQCKSWTDVQQVLQRMHENVLYAPRSSGIFIEVWAATAKNAVLWAFNQAPPALTVIQAQAMLHGVLRDMHQHLLGGEYLRKGQPEPHHATTYYVGVLEKLVQVAPTSSVEAFGIVLAYCYVHGSLLDEATSVTNVLSSMASVQRDRLKVVKGWIALRQNDLGSAVSLLQANGAISTTTPLQGFWLAYSWVHQRTRHNIPLHTPSYPSTAVSSDEIWTLLETAMAGDIRPIVCLNMQAWLLTQHRIVVGAAEDVTAGDCLAKAIALDYDQGEKSTNLSLFNYAMLLGRLGKWTDMQQVLQYCLDDIHVGPSTTQTTSPAPQESAWSISVRPVASPLTLATVQAYMARTCIQSQDYSTARVMFQRLELAATDRVSIGPFQLSSLVRDHVYVLLEVNAHREALGVCDAALQRYQGDPVLLLYKADALFCLEQVQECDWTLQQLDTALSGEDDDEAPNDLYAQVLNNQALVLACHGRTDDALRKLYDCRRRFPTCAHALLNLTVLLWRQGKQVAACTTWLAGRQIVHSSRTSADATTPPTSHVPAGQQGQICPQQIAALDRMVDMFWADDGRMRAIKQSLQVVEHYTSICGHESSSGNAPLNTPN